MRAGESAHALDDLHPTLAGELSESLREAADHPVLPGVELRQIDPGLAEVDAALGELLGLVDDGSGMEHGLGGDAAHVQADAAKHRETLDEDHLLAEVSSAEGGRVATGTGAENQNFGAHVSCREVVERQERLGM